MRRIVILAALAMAGCGTFNLAYDGDVECKGKVGLNINSNVQLGAGYGGGGSGTTSIVGDCGEGFVLRRTRRSGDRVVDTPPETPDGQPAKPDPRGTAAPQ
jgi:hypothetical protein